MYEIFVLSEKRADAYVRIMDLVCENFEEVSNLRLRFLKMIVKEIGKCEDLDNLMLCIKNKYNYEEKLKDKQKFWQNFCIIKRIEELCECHDNLKAACAYKEWCST